MTLPRDPRHTATFARAAASPQMPSSLAAQFMPLHTFAACVRLARSAFVSLPKAFACACDARGHARTVALQAALLEDLEAYGGPAVATEACRCLACLRNTTRARGVSRTRQATAPRSHPGREAGNGGSSDTVSSGPLRIQPLKPLPM